MRRKYQLLLSFLTILLISLIALNSCRPRDDISDSAIAPFSPDGISVLASPVATLDIRPFLARFRIVYVDPGWFERGADPEEDKLARGDETPQTDATEPGFWIGESEVTNLEYTQCVKAGVCSPPSLRDSGPTNHYGDPTYDDHPVVGVNWYQAFDYCEWVGSRLPTEGEWEKAARGDMGYIYPWGFDTPSCDRTNMNGCADINDTKPVASYPLGISPYGLYDMAGNVREWTADWYQPDVYLTAAYYHPSGASEGDGKVVRGGGFNDFDENLRTTARLALSPDQDYDDVGFRCVPTTPSYTPFCEPTYTTFCYDPRTPPPDEPCVPGEGVPGEDGLTFLGYGCPMNAVVNFQVGTNGGGNNGYTATVDGVPFDCQPSSAGEDVVNCVGPETPMGTTVEIIVCAPGSSPQTATAHMPASGIMPVKFTTSGEVSLMAATTANCPDGYVLDEATGACIRDESQSECPEGWTYNREIQQCMPDNPEEDCPEGTTFSANLEGCQPDDGECPEGFYLTALRVCEPDENRQDDCPPGYFYNAEIGCCDPIPPDNHGCEDNYYFNAYYERCIPVDDNNCPFGTTYNGYGQCDQEPGMPGPDDETEDDCPPGLLVTPNMNCDMPEDGYDEQNPAPGTMTRPGDQSNDGEGDCEDGYTYMANYNRCIEFNDDGCPEGYYLDVNLDRCRPTNGPGSPCPPGYVFNPKLNCCVPEPGMDGTRCPEDEPVDGGEGTPNDPTGAAGTPISNVTPFSNSSFDRLTGLCFDGESSNGEPSDGSENGDGEENPCPPGTFSANLTNCDQYPDGEQVPGTTTPDQGECPNYWNPETQTCDYPEPECGEFEYFDRYLGYCVPIQEDCCEAGYDFSNFYELCVPIVTKPRDGECPEGYELIDGVCWLIDRTLTLGLCETFSINTPRCIGPCEVGLIFNAQTGRCEHPPDPCAEANCSSLGADRCASNNCCEWVQTQTGGQGYCKDK